LEDTKIEVKAGHREILMKREASIDDEKELSLWWENGTEKERRARRSMLPTINEFFRHRIPYVHAKSNLWKGPVWLKLPPDLCLIPIITKNENMKTRRCNGLRNLDHDCNSMRHRNQQFVRLEKVTVWSLM